MTLKELNSLRDMHFHIRRLSDRIAEIESRSLPQSPNTDDHPRGSGETRSKTEQVVEAAEPHKKKLEKLKEDYDRKAEALELEIYAIEDEHIKAILVSRFIDAKSWRQVARCIGGGNTEDSVRKVVERLFQKN